MSDEKEQPPTDALPPTQDIDLEDRDAVGGIPLPQPQMVNNWKHGLCGCFDNVAICAITYFVPCVTYGEIAKALGKSCVVHGLLFAVPILNLILWLGQRGALRRERGIPGTALNDCCLIWCCTCCALSQEGQEVQHMEIEKRERQVAVAATVAVATTYAGQQPMQYPPPGAQGYPPQGAQSYPPPGAQGYPPQGYPPPGAQGYPPQGYPPQGAPGYPPQGASDGNNPPAYEPQYPEKGDIDRA